MVNRCNRTARHSAGLWFGVQRHFDAAPLGAEGERTFRVIGPRLQRVSRIDERIQQLSLGQAIAQGSLDALRAAVRMVDSARRCRPLNRAAECMLCGTDEPLTVHHGHLLASTTALDEQLAASVALACSRPPAPRSGARFEHGPVKTQLNALFAKTGTHSQPKLLRIAKTLPAVE